MISIITPVYNVESYIEQCIKSVLDQEFSDWEWLFVDDGSTDQSIDIIRKYADRDKRFRIYIQANQGPAAARNLALDHAEGDYIMFLDSDDWMEAGALIVIDNAIRGFNPDMVLWNFKRYKNGNVKKGSYPMPSPGFHNTESTQEYAIDFVYRYKQGKGQYFPACWIRAIKSDIIQNQRLRFNPLLKRTEDYMFLAETHSYLKNMYVLEDQLTVYRANEHSITHNYIEGYMSMIDEIYDHILKIHLNVSQEELIRRADLMYIYRAFVAIHQENKSNKKMGERFRAIKSILNLERLKMAVSSQRELGVRLFGKQFLFLRYRMTLPFVLFLR